MHAAGEMIKIKRVFAEIDATYVFSWVFPFFPPPFSRFSWGSRYGLDFKEHFWGRHPD
jgi:hypothetical protein